MTERQQPEEPETAITSSAEEAKAALSRIETATGIDLLTMGKVFAASGYFADAKTQAQAVTKILAGQEIGVPPMAAMQGYHCIPRKKKVDGQWVEHVEMAMSANLRAAIIKRSPNYDYRTLELTDEACEVEVASLFAGEWNKEPVRVTYEEMQKVLVPAGGGSNRPLTDGAMWKNYPKDMLFAAVMRRVAKRICPELFIGESFGDEADDLIVAEQTLTLEAGAVEAEQHSEYWDEDPSEAAPGDDAEPHSGEAAEPEPDAPSPVSEGEPGEAPSETPVEEPEEEEGIWVGDVLVPPSLEYPREPAAEADRCTDSQLAALKRIVGRLGLTDGALDVVVKARYGIKTSQMSQIAAGELGEWLKSKEKAGAKA